MTDHYLVTLHTRLLSQKIRYIIYLEIVSPSPRPWRRRCLALWRQSLPTAVLTPSPASGPGQFNCTVFHSQSVSSAQKVTCGEAILLYCDSFLLLPHRSRVVGGKDLASGQEREEKLGLFFSLFSYEHTCLWVCGVQGERAYVVLLQHAVH